MESWCVECCLQAGEGSPPWAVARPEEYRQLVQETLDCPGLPWTALDSGPDLAMSCHGYKLFPSQEMDTVSFLQQASLYK